MSAIQDFDAFMAGEQARYERARHDVQAIHASGKTVMQWAEERFAAAAIRRGIEITKHQARQFIATPHRLNRVGWGLADDFYSDPRAGLRRLDRLEAIEPKVAQFPINIALANLAAARLAFRVARRFAERPALQAAE